MGKTNRARYTLEFKLEAVRLIGAGQSIAATAAILGLPDQTLHNWLKAHREGRLGGPGAKPVTPEQMELARLRAELAKTKMELDIVKSRSVLREAVHVKYAFVDRHRGNWPISLLCEQLEVSPSGYHQHRQRRALHQGKPGGRISNDALLAHIKAIHAQVKGEYGWPRFWKQLLANGIRVGKERVRKLMALHGMKGKTKRKFKATTNSAHSLPVAPNLVARDFSPALPNQVWTTDITYLATDEGWLYLTVMLDLFSRQVVGWSIQPRMTQQLVVDALRMAWFRRRPAQGLIVHSDRGSQYCGHLVQSTLKAYGMRSSMSRKGDCWDNAPTESLWGSLKRACVYGQRFVTREEAKAAVMNWLAFYNATRLHSRLGYVSPMQFEKNWLAEQVRRSA